MLFCYFTGLAGFRRMEGVPNMGGFGVNRMGGRRTLFPSTYSFANIYSLKALRLGTGSVGEFKGNPVNGVTGDIGTSVGVKYLVDASDLCIKLASV